MPKRQFKRPTSPRRQPSYASMPQHAPDDRPHVPQFLRSHSWTTVTNVLVTERESTRLSPAEKVASADPFNRGRKAPFGQEPAGFTARGPASHPVPTMSRPTVAKSRTY